MTIDIEAITEEMVTAALWAHVPGGSEVWCWLPQKDAFTPHQTARDVIRAALEAVFGSGLLPLRDDVAAAHAIGRSMLARSEAREAELIAQNAALREALESCASALEVLAPRLAKLALGATASSCRAYAIQAREALTLPTEGVKTDG